MLFKSFNRECWLIKYTPTAGKDEKFSQLSKRGNTQIHKYTITEERIFKYRMNRSSRKKWQLMELTRQKNIKQNKKKHK